jgi:hypothetical protein
LFGEKAQKFWHLARAGKTRMHTDFFNMETNYKMAISKTKKKDGKVTLRLNLEK